MSRDSLKKYCKRTPSSLSVLVETGSNVEKLPVKLRQRYKKQMGIIIIHQKQWVNKCLHSYRTVRHSELRLDLDLSTCSASSKLPLTHRLFNAITYLAELGLDLSILCLSLSQYLFALSL